MKLTRGGSIDLRQNASFKGSIPSSLTNIIDFDEA
jgi:hypothetical protein